MFSLLYGLLLPWLTGALGLSLLWRRASKHHALLLGYGYVLASLGLTLWMRLLSFFGIKFSLLLVSAPLLLLIIVSLFLMRRSIRWPWAIDWKTTLFSDAWRRQVVWQRLVWWALALFIGFRILLLALQIWWQPLYPWDAWIQWATKARVWFELGYLAPFTHYAHWLTTEPAVYMDSAPHYPATVPLLQVWTALSLGRWDDSVINLPWLSFMLALGLAFYGQLRYWGSSPLYALLGAYLVTSLPFLNTHVALAGYADLPLAVVYGLAAMAFFLWTQKREWQQGLLALALALACPLIKTPGWVWLASFLPALLPVFFPRHGLKYLAGLGGAAVLGLAVLAETKPLILGYRLQLDFQPAWQPIGLNYFQFANWHLLWYGLPIALLLSFRNVLKPPLVSLSVLTGCVLAVLFVVFFFSSAYAWVEDFTTVNRATLHVVPLVLFYVLVLLRSAALRNLPSTTISSAT